MAEVRVKEFMCKTAHMAMTSAGAAAAKVITNTMAKAKAIFSAKAIGKATTRHKSKFISSAPWQCLLHG